MKTVEAVATLHELQLLFDLSWVDEHKSCIICFFSTFSCNHLKQCVSMFSARQRKWVTSATMLMLLLLFWCCEVVQLNPVGETLPSSSPSNASDRPRSSSYNKTCITENIENGTHLTIISSSMVTGSGNTSSPTAAFNERRRDMFFEDYNIKQIEVIDTSVVRNWKRSYLIKKLIYFLFRYQQIQVQMMFDQDHQGLA